jgi:hypothetical protein
MTVKHLGYDGTTRNKQGFHEETHARFVNVFSKDQRHARSDTAMAPTRPAILLFANGACQVLAYAFFERYPNLGFRARWIKPASGFTGNHIFVSDGTTTFDYHGFTTEPRPLALVFRRGRRFYPGWDARLQRIPFILDHSVIQYERDAP